MRARHLLTLAALGGLLGGLLGCKGDALDSPGDDSPTVEETGRGDTNDTGDTGVSVLEQRLRELLDGLPAPPSALEPPPAQDPALVALGEALFYDPLLSGNKDTACASCHHPAWGLGDGLPLALGTGAEGVGPARADGDRPAWLPRNAPPLFNVGLLEGLFWDSRVEATEEGLRIGISSGRGGHSASLHPLPSQVHSGLQLPDEGVMSGRKMSEMRCLSPGARTPPCPSPL